MNALVALLGLAAAGGAGWMVLRGRRPSPPAPLPAPLPVPNLFAPPDVPAAPAATQGWREAAAPDPPVVDVTAPADAAPESPPPSEIAPPAERPPEPAPASAFAVRGFVERVTASEVGGWAYCPEAPDAHLAVEVLRRGVVVGRAVADLYRPDLHLSGIGRGDHAFVAEVGAGAAVGADVVAVAADGQRTSLIWLAPAADNASVFAADDEDAGDTAI